jgi:hypothetical protein
MPQWVQDMEAEEEANEAREVPRAVSRASTHAKLTNTLSVLSGRCRTSEIRPIPTTTMGMRPPDISALFSLLDVDFSWFSSPGSAHIVPTIGLTTRPLESGGSDDNNQSGDSDHDGQSGGSDDADDSAEKVSHRYQHLCRSAVICRPSVDRRMRLLYGNLRLPESMAPRGLTFLIPMAATTSRMRIIS